MFPRRRRRGLIDPALYQGVAPSRRPIAWTIYRDSRMLEDSRHTAASQATRHADAVASMSTWRLWNRSASYRANV